MNIDHKLEPIAVKNIAAYFKIWIFFLLQIYCIISKISISLQIFSILGFIKTVIREIKYICRDWFTRPSYFVK